MTIAMEPATTTIAELETFHFPYDDTDDGKDHLTHIVRPWENSHLFVPGDEGQDIVDRARALQDYVIALCGHKFVPKRNPEKHPACQQCMDIAGQIMRDLGE